PSAKAGVFGASEDGAGVMGYSRSGYAGEFFGDVHVSGDIFLPGADCAELFDVDDPCIEAGDVVVIDHDGILRRSDSAYDKRVAGVISGAGRLNPGILLDSQKAPGTNRRPVALVGKVYCKVDARRHSIEVGDLLTTSSTAGHAMKATHP